MRKFFTFVFCAFCAVSVWGSEVEIGGSGNNDTNVPINLSSAYSASQSIYTATELTTAGLSANASISKIAFKYAASTEYTRNIKVYITNRSSDVALTYLSSSYKFDKVTSSDLYFDGAITTPTTSGTFYKITLSKNFVWDGTSNICIIVCDNTGTTGGAWKYHKASSVSATPGRCIYSTGSTVNPTSSYTYTGNINDYRPIIQITYTTGDDPTPTTTPTIDVTETELDFGSYYPAAETVSKTFTVTASNLTEDITFSAITGVSYNPTSIIKDNEALAGAGVEVTVTLGSEYAFPINNPKVSVASTGATSKSVTLKATRVVDGDFDTPAFNTAFNYENSQNNNHKGYVSYSAELTISEVANNQFKPYGNATFMVDYLSVGTTCEDGGKVTNLKGKFTSESIFKAFSFDYTAPEETGIVIDEEVDNHDTWPEAAQSGKSLSIKRTVVPGCWNTICLPTYLTSTQVTDIFGTNADVRSFIGANITSSSITLNFSEHPKTDGMEACVPYLIKPTQAMDNPLNLTYQSFNPTPGSVENNGIVFQGVLVPTVVGEGGDEYIIVGADNTLLHPTGSGTIKGMRAYFYVIGTEAKAALKTAKVSMNTGSTTELVLVKDNQTIPYKTMVNDQIVIVKEGQKVNIFGQIVK